jgi:aspartyl-tRNA(Asn)/glutamyl-tRNA(Gln) amidotransferase subunit A
VFQAAIEVFTEFGATVETADLGFEDPVDPFHMLWFAGAAKSTDQLTADARAELGPRPGRDHRAGHQVQREYLTHDGGTQLAGHHHGCIPPALPAAAYSDATDPGHREQP